MVYLIYFYILLHIYQTLKWVKKNVQNILKKLPDPNEDEKLLKCPPCPPCNPQEQDQNSMNSVQAVKRGRPSNNI
jgi:hypothetical protein